MPRMTAESLIMNNKQVKNKKRHPARGGMTGTVVITVIITLLFALIIYLMYFFNIVSVLDLSEYLLDNGSDNSLLQGKDNLYDDLLSDTDFENYDMIYKMTPEELTSILSEFKEKEHYSIIAQTVNYSLADSKTTRLEAKRDGESFEINKYTADKLIETTISDGDYVNVTDIVRNRSSKHKYTSEFGFEALCSIPSLTPLTDICKDIIDKGEDSVTEYDISFVSSESGGLYKAVFTYTDINQREEYYVSPDSGMIVSLYSYLGDNLYYRYSLLEFNENPA